MRLTISNKISIVCACLISSSLLMAGVVLFTLGTLTEARKELETVRLFQLHVKSLQHVRSEIVLQHVPPDNGKLHDAFSRVVSLATDIDTLLRRRKLGVPFSTEPLVDKVELSQQAYYEMYRLYKSDHAFLELNNQIFEILKQRIRNSALDNKDGVEPFLAQLMVLQLRIHRHHDGQTIAEVKQLGQRMIGLVEDDPAFAKNVNAFVGNIEDNFNNYRLIESKNGILQHTAETVDQITNFAVSELSALIGKLQKQLAFAVICLSLLLIVITIIFGKMTSRYVERFLAVMGAAVASINSGKFDFTMPRVPNDELGDLVASLGGVGQSVRENLQKIADSESQIRNVVENVSDWIWEVDENGNCVYTSPQIEKILGRVASEVKNEPIARVLGLKGTGIANDNFLERLPGRIPFDDRIHSAISKDGQEMVLETSGRPVFEGERFCGYRLISRDISVWRATEEELRRKSYVQKFQNELLGLSLLDLDLDVILDKFLSIVLDARWLSLEPVGAIFLVNSAENALNLQVQKGLTAEVQNSCQVVPFGVCICGKAAQTGQVVFCDTLDERHEISYSGIHLHGHYCVPIHSVAGRVIGVLTLYIKDQLPRDPHVESVLISASTILGGIIKRRQVEEKLFRLNLDLENQVEQRTAQLTVANKELDTFAYSVSHDLRAPLRAIDGFSHALQEDCAALLDDESKGYLERIIDGCHKMGQLIDDILQLSRLTRGDICTEQVDLSAMVSEITASLQDGASEKKRVFHIEEGCLVQADPVMVRAVLENLLGNAWKYSANVESPCIEFGSVKQDDETVYWIRDNGAGFDMKYKEKLFIAFQRLHSVSEFEGSGIGLATVQRIIHRHGGRVWAESEVGKGATFYFTLQPR